MLTFHIGAIVSYPREMRNREMSTVLCTKFLKEAHEIVGMFFLHREYGLHQASGRGIVVAKVIDHIAIAIDGDTLSDQILFDHIDQQLPFYILGVTPGRKSIRRKVGLSAELHDA